MYDPATALPDIYLREEGNLDPHKNPDTSFTIVLFVIAQNWQQPGSDHNGWMVRQTVEHSHHGTPSSNNQGTVDTCNNLDKSPRHHVEGKISTIPYHMLSRTWYLWNDMIRQMESRLLVAGGGRLKWAGERSSQWERFCVLSCTHERLSGFWDRTTAVRGAASVGSWRNKLWIKRDRQQSA